MRSKSIPEALSANRSNKLVESRAIGFVKSGKPVGKKVFKFTAKNTRRSVPMI